MDAIKKLQQAYKAKQLKRKDYLAQLKEMLDGEEIDQDTYDEARDYDPAEDDGGVDKPIYTQTEVDRIIVNKARSLVRKALKDAGVTVDAANNVLLDEVVKLVQAGQGKVKPDNELQKEVDRLTRELKVSGSAGEKLKSLMLENAVYKALAISEYKPINVNQVVRALKADYVDLIEFDDDNNVVQKTVSKAIRRVADSEPNLFEQDDEGGEINDDDLDGTRRKGTDTDDDGPGFRGKGPGGTPGASAATKQKQYEAKKKEALDLLGIKQAEK
jgi:hypothetical protein